MEYVSKGAEETRKIAEDFVKTLKLPAVIAMYGDLGAGKTVFASGVARGLGINEYIVSPTFNISLEYEGDGVKFIHYDMYRVDDDTLYDTGFYDSISDDRAVVLMEWSENIPGAIEDGFYKVTINKDDGDENIRHISIEGGVI